MTNQDDGWESCTWEGAERSRMRANLRLSLAEKIQIIEGLQQIAHQLQPTRTRMGRVLQDSKFEFTTKEHKELKEKPT